MSSGEIVSDLPLLCLLKRASQRTPIISQRAIKGGFTWHSRNVFNLNINLRRETSVQRYIEIPVVSFLKYFDRAAGQAQWLWYTYPVSIRPTNLEEYVVHRAYVAFLARLP